MISIFLVRDRKAFSTKWVCDFGSELDNLGYNVSIVCNDKKYKASNDVNVNRNVKKINLAKRKELFTSLKFKKYIVQHKPDIIFAYFTIDLFNLRYCLNKAKVIMMFHNPPIEVFEKIKKWRFKRLLKKTSSIQVLMPEFVKQIQDFIGDVEV